MPKQLGVVRERLLGVEERQAVALRRFAIEFRARACATPPGPGPEGPAKGSGLNPRMRAARRRLHVRAHA